MGTMGVEGLTRAPWRRAMRAALLLGTVLLGVARCGALPYSGPPDQSTGESEHGRSG